MTISTGRSPGAERAGVAVPTSAISCTAEEHQHGGNAVGKARTGQPRTAVRAARAPGRRYAHNGW
ncbi:MAG: hypothetical protein WKF47_11475 [Geodermatophilaceae bacterium]